MRTAGYFPSAGGSQISAESLMPSRIGIRASNWCRTWAVDHCPRQRKARQPAMAGPKYFLRPDPGLLLDIFTSFDLRIITLAYPRASCQTKLMISLPLT